MTNRTENKNCIVAQSGGPTAAINASLAGVIQGVFCSESFDTIYGSINGILGILNNRLMNLSEQSQNRPHFIETLKTSPAMYLGSCRYKLPDYKEDTEPYQKKNGHYGKRNGSPNTIIDIPKTIDNDLCITDHTPGYGSAAKFVASSLLEIAHDTFIYAVKSVTIVEIMGRDAGWLTAAAALARNDYNAAPHLIYLPEVAFSKETFLHDVEKLLTTKNNVIIAVSEGIRDEEGNYISSAAAAADTFGHSQLSGTGKALEYMIKDHIGVKVRSIELNVLQRCASHTASLTDLNESFQLGVKAVEGAEQGETMCMLTMHRTSQVPYCINIHFSSVDDIANQAKSIPREWINEAGNDVTPELLDYMRPLIQGEPDLKYQEGLPVYLPVDHLL